MKQKTVIGCIVFTALLAIIFLEITSAAPAGKAPATVKPVKKMLSVGEPLVSFSDLNTIVASDKNTAMVVIPAPGKAGVTKKIIKAINAAKRKLEAQGAIIGLYTLRADSVDYSSVAEQAALPGILIIVKGHGMELVTGEITEATLLQAYAAASRASSSGCSCMQQKQQP
jgi:hypothetical protein